MQVHEPIYKFSTCSSGMQKCGARAVTEVKEMAECGTCHAVEATNIFGVLGGDTSCATTDQCEVGCSAASCAVVAGASLVGGAGTVMVV